MFHFHIREMMKEEEEEGEMYIHMKPVPVYAFVKYACLG